MLVCLQTSHPGRPHKHIWCTLLLSWVQLVTDQHMLKRGRWWAVCVCDVCVRVYHSHACYASHTSVLSNKHAIQHVCVHCVHIHMLHGYHIQLFMVIL